MSYFAALERQIPAVRAERMMDGALSAVYAQLDSKGAQKLWSSWAQQIQQVAARTAHRAGALFTINGEPTNTAGLKRWLRSIVGSKGMAA